MTPPASSPRVVPHRGNTAGGPARHRQRWRDRRATSTVTVVPTVAPTPAISATPNPVQTAAPVLFDAGASHDGRHDHQL